MGLNNAGPKSALFLQMVGIRAGVKNLSIYKSLTLEICENGVIKAGVNGAGDTFGPALLRPIRYLKISRETMQ